VQWEGAARLVIAAATSPNPHHDGFATLPLSHYSLQTPRRIIAPPCGHRKGMMPTFSQEY